MILSKVYIGVILLFLVLLTGCSDKYINGSTQCNIDSDCESIGGSTYGCYNKDNLPSHPNYNYVDAYALGPKKCECIENRCISVLENYLCLNNICLFEPQYNIPVNKEGIIVFTFTNNNTDTQIFYYDLIERDSGHNIGSTIPNNVIKLRPNETNKTIILINTNKIGKHVMSIIVTGEDSVKYYNDFILNIYK